MNINRIIFTPLERDIIARIVWTPLAIILTAFMLLTGASAQNVDDYIVRQKIASTGRVVDRFIPKAANTLWGTGPDGLPQQIIIGANLSLGSGSLIATPPSTISWSTVTSKPTTLSGYGITDALTAVAAAAAYAPMSHTQAISTVTGLQAALDAKAATSHTQAWSTITSTPTTLAGYGITEFSTDAFIFTNVTNSLTSGQRGLGRVSGRDTMQAGGGTLQWYQSGSDKIMAWSGRIQASQMDLTAVSVFTTAPTSSTSPGEAGQMAFDANFFYVCVAFNSWKRSALSSW
jgi:phage-related tail fiber protein